MTIDLGKRIRYFRERAGLKQEDIELQAGFAQGLMSRIENNKINPSKETIQQIVDVLELNSRETNYLIGQTALPATDKEIGLALEDVKKFLDKRGVIAYVLDDRWRLIAISKTFERVLDKMSLDKNKLFKHTVIRLLLDDKLAIKQLIDQEDYKDILQAQLTHYYSAVGFMKDDPYFKDTMRFVQKDFFAKSIIDKIDRGDRTKVWTISQSKLSFVFKNNIRMKMHYYCQSLIRHPRFDLVECIPDNVMLRLLSKL